MKTEEEMLQQLAACCATKECCLQELRQKLIKAELADDAMDRILGKLQAQHFVDEARYARAFINDKYRFNKWGRIKISYELGRKGITSAVRQEAMEVIDEAQYEALLTDLLRTKLQSTKARNGRELAQKLYRFAASRGFESELIIQSIYKISHTDDEDSLDMSDMD